MLGLGRLDIALYDHCKDVDEYQTEDLESWPIIQVDGSHCKHNTPNVVAQLVANDNSTFVKVQIMDQEAILLIKLLIMLELVHLGPYSEQDNRK